MTEALVFFFSTAGSLEGAWSIAAGKLLTLSEQQFVDRDTVDTACNGMKRCAAKSQMKALVTELFKGHVDFMLRRQRPKSVFHFKSDRVFHQQNSELVSQNAGYKR